MKPKKLMKFVHFKIPQQSSQNLITKILLERNRTVKHQAFPKVISETQIHQQKPGRHTINERLAH